LLGQDLGAFLRDRQQPGVIEIAEGRQAMGQLADGLQFLVAHNAVGGGDNDHDVNKGRVMADDAHVRGVRCCYAVRATLCGLTLNPQARQETSMATHKKPGKWRTRTLAVRGGQMRSPFQETSEALYLTSGYAYEAAEEAEARFAGEATGYQYSRFGNPTVTMFEQRMA